MVTTAIPTGRLDSIPQLAKLARRLQSWRAVRKARERIPQQLWEAAAKLAAIHGVSRVSTALRLSYSDLRRRTAKSTNPVQMIGPTFVELPPPLSSGAGTFVGDTLDLLTPGGARLVVRLANRPAPEVLRLLELLLTRPQG